MIGNRLEGLVTLNRELHYSVDSFWRCSKCDTSARLNYLVQAPPYLDQARWSKVCACGCMPYCCSLCALDALICLVAQYLSFHPVF